MGGTQANAAPKHEVRLSAFKMSAHEVTFAQYDVFCEDKNREKPDDEGWGRGQRPVINVSWDDATAFAKWMGCRLPTEAEWEYACRAGSTTDFNTGKKPTNTQANYQTNPTRARIAAVGSFAANAWGLYDMHGNAWEWCSDWFGNYASSPQTNPIGPSEGKHRIYRGGSWKSKWHSCRSWYRNKIGPGYLDNSIGFRLVSLQ
jgi:formylglycine-generating enzyme required for sulfatase activity